KTKPARLTGLKGVHNPGLTLRSRACQSDDDQIILLELAVSHLGFGSVGDAELDFNRLRFAGAEDIEGNTSPTSGSTAATTTRGAARFSGADGWRSPGLLPTQQFLSFILLVGWFEAHGHIRDGQDIFFAIDQKLHVRRHAGFEQLFFVIDPHDRIVGYHVLDDRWRITHLVHPALETARGKSIDGKTYLLTFSHVPDIGLIYRSE